MRTIRFGLIGAGSIATITARELRGHANVELRAVADPSESRRAALASSLKIGACYAHADELLRDPEIDAVYVAVPNTLHASLASDALTAGKHVLLDKPFALSAVEAQQVADTADASGKTLMLGMNQRFDANVQRAKQMFEAGTLGDVYHAKAFWRRRSGIPRIGSWFTNKATSGGGALLDIGVHMLDTSLYVLGNFQPVSVSGATYTRFGQRGLGDGDWGKSEREHTKFDVDDFATALIRLDTGTTISLDAAWALHQPRGNDMGVYLYGEDAGLSVYEDLLYRQGENGEYYSIEGSNIDDLRYPHCSRAHHFVNVLLGEEEPAVTLDEALSVQRILDAIYLSSQTGEEVRL